MIKKLNHANLNEAENIRNVFQRSYAIEARLLNATYFPPLHRPLEEFVQATSDFYGFFENECLAAVIEIKTEDGIIHIQSLVVDPDFFRKGIASMLLKFIFSEYPSSQFTVETGAANGPAIALYERYGFHKVRQWMTDVGIEKVGFEKPV